MGAQKRENNSGGRWWVGTKLVIPQIGFAYAQGEGGCSVYHFRGQRTKLTETGFRGMGQRAQLCSRLSPLCQCFRGHLQRRPCRQVLVIVLQSEERKQG